MDLNRLIRRESGLAELESHWVHVWRVRTAVSATELQGFEEHLAPDELERARGFRLERDRRRFAVCRGCLRLLAGSYLQKDPAAIAFCCRPQGKPQLSGALSQELRFNVSHSGELVLLAFSRDREVGVDVERKGFDLDFESLAQAYFSQVEHTAVMACPLAYRADLFFELWTCKEACVKADGRGLSISLGRFSVIPSSNSPWREVVVAYGGTLGSGMRVRALDSENGYTAALAASGSDWDVVQIDLAQ